MTVFLFTDFGIADIYVGQIKAVLQRLAPGVAVIDLLHEAPPYKVRSSAHLLAALAAQISPASVTLAVVDPGVGSARAGIAADADGRWFVGPDNGLLSVLAARAQSCAYWRVTWRPEKLSASFHGRDLFAPIAAAIATGDFPGSKAESIARLDVELGATDLGEIIYIDHFGNAITGLRARSLSHETRVVAGDHSLRHERVFSDAPAGAVFWYENSLGLIEIAGSECSAAVKLSLVVGQSVGIGC